MFDKFQPSPPDGGHKLPPSLRRVYAYLRSHLAAGNESPTIRELAKSLGLRSVATVHTHLKALEEAGLITRIRGAHRSIVLTASAAAPAECEIPLMGIVSAGRPIEAVLASDLISVPRDMVGQGRHYALRVRGESMLDVHICDGDIIIVRACETADPGATVVALVDDTEATVKRYFPGRNAVTLKPANVRFPAIVISPPGRLRVQGEVSGVLRRY